MASTEAAPRDRVPTRLRMPRIGVAAAFALNGVLLGAWASRIPDVMARHGLGEAGLGVLLLLMGIGALASFPVAGRLSDSLGAIRVTRGIALAYLATLVLVGFAPSVPLLGVALLLFGAAHGAMDVTMNSWASEVERALGRSVMSSFHAMWSVGAGVGAVTGFAATSLGAGVGLQFLAVSSLATAVLLPFLFVDWTSTRRERQSGAPVFAIPRGALVLVGLVALSSGLGEGAMVDWSAVYLRDVIGTGASTATLGFAVFSVTMVAVRLCADPVVTRFGRGRVARAGGLSAALGLALVTGPLAAWATFLGFVLMGIGYATLAPLAFSRAASDPNLPPGQAIASVATFGYGAMLLGPPAIGFVAEASSLRLAFALIGGLALLVAALAPVLDHPGPDA
jgi:MFS family permease